jgi:phage-related protein
MFRRFRRCRRKSPKSRFQSFNLEAIYVLHAFQKKSKRGIATPKKDLDLIQRRLAEAERLHREGQN